MTIGSGLTVTADTTLNGNAAVTGLTTTGSLTVTGEATVNSFSFSSGSTAVNAISNNLVLSATALQLPTALAVINYVGSSSNTIIHDTANDSIALTAGSTLPMTFGIKGSTSMVLDQNGNVGIGTTNPNTNFVVQGQADPQVRVFNTDHSSKVSIGAGSGYGSVSVVSTSSVGYFQGYRAGGSVDSPTQLLGSVDIVEITPWGMDEAGNYRLPSSVKFGTEGDISSASAPGNIRFATTPSGSVTPVERLRITSSGSVGINTAAPRAKMEVTGGLTVTGDTTVAGILTVGSPAGRGFATGPGSLYVQDTLEVDGSVYLGDLTSDRITVLGTMNFTGDTTFGGSVLISGNETVTGLISTGSLTTSGDVTVGLAAQLYGSANPDVFVKGNVEADGTLYGNALMLSTGNTVNEITASAPTSSSTDLQVPTALAVYHYVSVGSSTLIRDTNPTMTSVSVSSTANPRIVFKVTDGVSMVIDQNGNLGIGTTQPAHLLDVAGRTFPIGLYGSDLSLQGEIAASGTSTTRTVGFNLPGTASNTGDNWVINQFNGVNNKVYVGDDGTLSYINSGTGHGLFLGAGLAATTAATPNLALLTNGYVGVGTIAPRTRFEVSGGLTVTGDTTIAGILSVGSPAGREFATGPGSLYVQDTLEVDGSVYLGDLFSDRITVLGTMNFTGDTTFGGSVLISGNETVTGLMMTGSLTVTGEATVNSFAFSSGSTFVNAITNNLNASASAVQLPTAASVIAYVGSTSNTIIQDTASDSIALTAGAANPIAFTVKGSNSMVIDQNGNVGIGTVLPGTTLAVMAPNQTLHNGVSYVNQAILTNDVVGADLGGSLGLGGQINTAAPRIFGVVAARKDDATIGTQAGYMQLATNRSGTMTEVVRITSAGNVGINTTAPRQVLEVAGSVTVTGDVTIGAATTNFSTTNSDLFVKGNVEVDASVYVGGTAAGSTNAVIVNNAIAFQSEVLNDCTGGTAAVDWSKGNKQSLLTGVAVPCTVTFHPPPGMNNLLLKINHSGSELVTWATVGGAIKWPGGNHPALTTGGIDVTTFYYDGTNYYGTAGYDFQ